MRIERVQPQLLRLEVHPMEMVALITAARWVVGGHHDPPPAEALDQLRRLLDNYDRQIPHLRRRPPQQEQVHAG
jgi:hypothetical protein